MILWRRVRPTRAARASSAAAWAWPRSGDPALRPHDGRRLHQHGPGAAARRRGRLPRRGGDVGDPARDEHRGPPRARGIPDRGVGQRRHRGGPVAVGLARLPAQRRLHGGPRRRRRRRRPAPARPRAGDQGLRDGYVSAEAGRDLYGVVLTGEGELDAAATRRSARPSARAGSGTRPSARSAQRPAVRALGIVNGRWRCALCEQTSATSTTTGARRPSRSRARSPSATSSCTPRSVRACRPSRSSCARTSARAVPARWRST